MKPEPGSDELGREIRAEFGTVHAFCRARPELGRSTVYQVLRGLYPGNAARQEERIRAALEGEGEEEKRIAKLLLRVACKHCRAKRTRKKCAACRDLCRMQAVAVMESRS